jgi:hypothetical protein
MKEIANAANVSHMKQRQWYVSFSPFEILIDEICFIKRTKCPVVLLLAHINFLGGVEYLILRYVRVFVSVVALYGF